MQCDSDGTREAAASSRTGDSAPYLDALERFADSEPARLTVPGHKGGRAAPRGLLDTFGSRVFELDVSTLVPGVDVGGPGATPLERARQLAAQAWGARRTWFLVHGASQGNLAACLAVRAAEGRRVVVQRNVHASVIDGLVLSGLDVRWVLPEIDETFGVAHGLTAASLDAALAAAPGAAAAFVVAPTYHGAMPDVAALTEVAHARGAALIVDEAWGSHLPFHPALPAHALESGADLVVSSTHKSLGSLTGTAMLHHGPHAERRLPGAAVTRALELTESTSPSSLGMASLDAARARAANDGEALLEDTLRAVARTRRALRRLPGVRVLGPEHVGRPGMHAFDPLRLTVDLRETGRDGRAVARHLSERCNIELEFATSRLLVAVFGLADGALGLGERLSGTLLEALWSVPPRRPLPLSADRLPAPGATAMTPRDAWLAPRERVPAGEAIGRIAGETLSPYPPGIPAVLPGEHVTAEVVRSLTEMARNGTTIRGAADGLETIGVLRRHAEPERAPRRRSRRAHRSPRSRRTSAWSR